MPNPDRWTEQRNEEQARWDRGRDQRRYGEEAYGAGYPGERSFQPRDRGDADRFGYGDYNPGYGIKSERRGEGRRVFGERETGASYTSGERQSGSYTPPGDGYPVRWGGQGTRPGPYDARSDAPPSFHGESFRNADAYPSHRGKGPRGYKRSDERIMEEINDRLTEDHHLDASDIEVKVEGGEATLSGTVPDRSAKHRAEQLIEHLTGVSHVQNNLRVQRSNDAGGFGERTPGSTDRLV